MNYIPMVHHGHLWFYTVCWFFLAAGALAIHQHHDLGCAKMVGLDY